MGSGATSTGQCSARQGHNPRKGGHVAHMESVSENYRKGFRWEDRRTEEGVGPGLERRRGGGVPLPSALRWVLAATPRLEPR